MINRLNYAEFYITNHCNIACSGCNRFNNYKFSGSEDWDSYCNIYKEWSSLLNIDHIAILGGEPLLHPKLKQILNDVRSFWPNATIEITTNGLLIERIKPDLLQCLIDNNIQIYCSLHHPDWEEKIKKSMIDKFGNLELLEKKRIIENNPAGVDKFLTDTKNKIVLEYTYYFHQSALVKTKNNKFTVHNSNYEKAHSNCDMKHSFHFFKGDLYKCGLMVTLPQILEQKPEMFKIEKQQLNLLNEYTPVTLEHIKSGADLYDMLYSPMPQCEFCPEEYHYHEISTE